MHQSVAFLKFGIFVDIVEWKMLESNGTFHSQISKVINNLVAIVPDVSDGDNIIIFKPSFQKFYSGI